MFESQTDILFVDLPQLAIYVLIIGYVYPKPFSLLFAPNHQGLNRVESPRAQRLVLKLLKKQA